ncbi:hypothetical protein PM082_011098 [Marasmius tenuissimus]|nr:hypothetical protein PM082_011098 [Marasmius tenuissimus]
MQHIMDLNRFPNDSLIVFKDEWLTARASRTRIRRNRGDMMPERFELLSLLSDSFAQVLLSGLGCYLSQRKHVKSGATGKTMISLSVDAVRFTGGPYVSGGNTGNT